MLCWTWSEWNSNEWRLIRFTGCSYFLNVGDLYMYLLHVLCTASSYAFCQFMSEMRWTRSNLKFFIIDEDSRSQNVFWGMLPELESKFSDWIWDMIPVSCLCPVVSIFLNSARVTWQCNVIAWIKCLLFVQWMKYLNIRRRNACLFFVGIFYRSSHAFRNFETDPWFI